MRPGLHWHFFGVCPTHPPAACPWPWPWPWLVFTAHGLFPACCQTPFTLFTLAPIRAPIRVPARVPTLAHGRPKDRFRFRTLCPFHPLRQIYCLWWCCLCLCLCLCCCCFCCFCCCCCCCFLYHWQWAPRKKAPFLPSVSTLSTTLD